MIHTPVQYAQALVVALRGKTERQRKQIAGHLFRRLLRARALKHLDRILAEATRMERREKGAVLADIRSAAPLGARPRRAIKQALGRKSAVTETTDPRLLAGVRILINEETLIDATALRRLTTLFS